MKIGDDILMLYRETLEGLADVCPGASPDICGCVCAQEALDISDAWLKSADILPSELFGHH